MGGGGGGLAPAVTKSAGPLMPIEKFFIILSRMLSLASKVDVSVVMVVVMKMLLFATCSPHTQVIMLTGVYG